VSHQEERPNVVFDTMVVFQAAANTEGPAAELFRRLEVKPDGSTCMSALGS